MMATAHIELPQLKLKQEMVLVVLIACSLFSFFSIIIYYHKLGRLRRRLERYNCLSSFSSIEATKDDSY
jgi:hypothetical protein